MTVWSRFPEVLSLPSLCDFTVPQGLPFWFSSFWQVFPWLHWEPKAEAHTEREREKKKWQKFISPIKEGGSPPAFGFFGLCLHWRWGGMCLFLHYFLNMGSKTGPSGKCNGREERCSFLGFYSNNYAVNDNLWNWTNIQGNPLISAYVLLFPYVPTLNDQTDFYSFIMHLSLRCIVASSILTLSSNSTLSITWWKFLSGYLTMLIYNIEKYKSCHLSYNSYL